MWERWRPILMLAAGLFAIGVAVRVISWWRAEDNEKLQDQIAWVGFAAIGVTLAVVAFQWARRHPMVRVELDLAGAAAIAMALTVLVGPLITGGDPFAGGAGLFFAQIWLYSGVAIGGALLGLLLVMALGKDYRAVQLRRYAESQRAKPRRPVRR